MFISLEEEGKGGQKILEIIKTKFINIMKKILVIIFLSSFSYSQSFETNTPKLDVNAELNTAGCKIRLLSIKCKKTEDWMGEDEIYIEVNSSRTKIFYMSKGEVINLANLPLFNNNQSGFIKLYDQDDGKDSLIDSDDHLGTWKVLCEEAEKGLRTAKFTLDDANYEIEYEVYNG